MQLYINYLDLIKIIEFKKQKHRRHPMEAMEELCSGFLAITREEISQIE